MMTRNDLAKRVKHMAILMAEVSGEMKYFGGFDEEYLQHSAELANASVQAWQWFERIQDSAEDEPLAG